MWCKSFRWLLVYAILTLLLSKPSKCDYMAHRVLEAIKKTLNYILKNYEKINVDCLYGVVIAGAILNDAAKCASPHLEQLGELNEKIETIYMKSLPYMKDSSNWVFTKHMVDRSLWQIKKIAFKSSKFSNLNAERKLVADLFNPKSYDYFTNLSDFCLGSLINATLSLEIKTCQLERNCTEFLDDLTTGPGYIKTHKLLFLQTAKQRNCKLPPEMYERSAQLLCVQIFKEIISVDRLSSLDHVFDLFLEQSLLCGIEGFSDFLQPKWLTFILEVQHRDGCFPAIMRRRSKRDFHIWRDGCSDHTTGLGAAVLSLYLDFIVKSKCSASWLHSRL